METKLLQNHLIASILDIKTDKQVLLQKSIALHTKHLGVSQT